MTTECICAGIHVDCQKSKALKGSSAPHPIPGTYDSAMCVSASSKKVVVVTEGRRIDSPLPMIVQCACVCIFKKVVVVTEGCRIDSPFLSLNTTITIFAMDL